jgi:hypothetical protein
MFTCSPLSMIQSTQNTISALIAHYGLELEDIQVDSVVRPWLDRYEPTWIMKAIVESLYRGRYKVTSVDRILQDWERIGEPRYWFSAEYERGILARLPEIFAMGLPGVISPIDRSSRQNLGMSPPIFISADDPNPSKPASDEDSSSGSEIAATIESPPNPPAANPDPSNPPSGSLHSASQLLMTLNSIIDPTRQNFAPNPSPNEDRSDNPG